MYGGQRTSSLPTYPTAAPATSLRPLRASKGTPPEGHREWPCKLVYSTPSFAVRGPAQQYFRRGSQAHLATVSECFSRRAFESAEHPNSTTFGNNSLNGNSITQSTIAAAVRETETMGTPDGAKAGVRFQNAPRIRYAFPAKRCETTQATLANFIKF